MKTTCPKCGNEFNTSSRIERYFQMFIFGIIFGGGTSIVFSIEMPLALLGIICGGIIVPIIYYFLGDNY